MEYITKNIRLSAETAYLLQRFKKNGITWNQVVLKLIALANIPLPENITVPVDHVSDFLRHEVIRRDKHVCKICMKSILCLPAEIDHIYPKSLGGGNGLENLQLLCAVCNQKKSNNLPL